MNIVIPMAGGGTRFAKAGYVLPKPLIDVNGKPMIQRVVENLDFGISAKYTFIVQRDHYDRFDLGRRLDRLAHDCNIICIDGVTEGAALTVLLARHIINNDQPLVIANSDQLMEWDNRLFLQLAREYDGVIFTFLSESPKHSYAKIDKEGVVTEVAEKIVISPNATVGVYYWKKGMDFVDAAEDMVFTGETANGEYYVCPAFNNAIKAKKRISILPVDYMHGLGTPEELKKYLGTKK